MSEQDQANPPPCGRKEIVGNCKIYLGDCRDVLRSLPAHSVQCCVTSPPYFGLRNYDHEKQIGLEHSPDAYVDELVSIFREVYRVLRTDGTLWLNLGDSYANVGKWGGSSGGKHANDLHGNSGIGRGKRNYGDLKGKDLIGIPWRVAFALQADGWYLRQDIIWSKPNPMPESVKDRCTKSHEYIFLLSKNDRYFFDAEAIKEPVSEATKSRHAQNVGHQEGSHRVPFKSNGPMKAVGNSERRNRRSVWAVTTKPFKGAHFATFPQDLIRPCILAGCPEGGIVLDPFFGAGTTGVVAAQYNRAAIGIELNPEYVDLATARLRGDAIVAKTTTTTSIPPTSGIIIPASTTNNRQMSLL